MKNIYAIRDRIANDLAGYFPLVVFRTDQQAVRYLSDCLTQEGSQLSKHPHDYELIVCGTVDDDGTICHKQTPAIVITGTALMAAQTEHQPKLVKAEA